MASSLRQHLLVAAIDFGTTYSGYAFSFLKDYKKEPWKTCTNTWTSSRSLLSLKAPTCVLFDLKKTFHSFGYDAEDKYVNLSEEGDEKEWYYFRRFKMTLYNKMILERNFELETEDGKKMPAMTVFSSCIKYLVDHLFQSCQDKIIGIERTDIRWVLTVPAIWNDVAKLFMREAAEKAGIPGDQLLIALEPEAASLFCSHLPNERLPGVNADIQPFQPGSKYLVLDAGACIGADNSVKDIPTSRISGGESAYPHDFPWQTSIQYHTGYHFCGGALIDPYWILTAAHCMENQPPGQIRVVLGEHTLSETEGSEQYRNISRIIISPFYNGARPEYGYYLPYDLALLELKTPVNINYVVKPVSLPDPNVSYNKRTCIVTGWGKTGVNADGADILQMAEINTLDNYVCRYTWGYYIYYGNICVYTYGVTPCQGDSGGPLVCLDTNGFVLVGISSWGDIDCGDHPSIYTRVTENLGWIHDVIDNDGHH